MQRNQKQEAGFTLIEVIVVIAVVAILAAILTPTITKNIDDSKRARTVNECQVMAASIASFYKDVGRWPSRDNTGADNQIELLYGDGTTPTVAGAGTANWIGGGGWGGADQDTFTNQLIANAPGGVGAPYATTGELAWRGPYATEYRADPWGNRYACNIIYGWTATANNAVWILSAGPNGQVQTNAIQSVVGPPVVSGDDIVARIK